MFKLTRFKSVCCIIRPNSRVRFLSSDRPLARLTFDTPFKKAFSNSSTLKDFLNAVFDKQFTITSINNVEKPSFLMRSIIYDLHCSLSDGTTVIIELQKHPMGVQMVDRCVGYASRDYNGQWLPSKVTEAGKGEYSLIPVLCVAICDWKFAEDKNSMGALPTLVQSYACNIVEGGGVPSWGIQKRLGELHKYTFIQLPYAPAKANKSCSDIEKWAILIRDSQNFSFNSLPSVLKEEPFLKAVNCARWEILNSEESASLQREIDKEMTDSAVLSHKDNEILEERRQKEEERRQKEEERRLKEKALAKLREFGYFDEDFYK